MVCKLRVVRVLGMLGKSNHSLMFCKMVARGIGATGALSFRKL